jgi:hypothetical protein
VISSTLFGKEKRRPIKFPSALWLAFQLPQRVIRFPLSSVTKANMHRAKYDTGLRASVRDHAVLRLPSRMLATLLAMLFLVSTQLCYAMVHDSPSQSMLSDCHMNMPHEMDATSGSADTGKSAPMDHGAKTPNACLMMTCGCVVQLATDLRADVPSQNFGLPPLVAALSGKSPNRDLRPPISLQV